MTADAIDAVVASPYTQAAPERKDCSTAPPGCRQ